MSFSKRDPRSWFVADVSRIMRRTSCTVVMVSAKVASHPVTVKARGRGPQVHNESSEPIAGRQSAAVPCGVPAQRQGSASTAASHDLPIRCSAVLPFGRADRMVNLMLLSPCLATSVMPSRW